VIEIKLKDEDNMTAIAIFATSNSKQTGVEITDLTDWTALGVPRSVLTSVSVELYGTSLVTPESTYALTAPELATYVADGFVEILFTSLAGSINVSDGWWTVRVTGNSSAYISNYSGFGIYSDITYGVWSLINSLHTPQEVKYDAESYAIPAIFLKGLGYLDTTNVNSRDVKFQKRLLSLQKMLLNI